MDPHAEDRTIELDGDDQTVEMARQEI